MTTDSRIVKLRALPLTEQAFQRRIIDCAHAYKWLVQHTRPALTSKGWRTPVEGDAGGPDLLLMRAGVTLCWEVKRQDGVIRLNQRPWIAAGVQVVRPSDWDSYVLPTLQGKPPIFEGEPA